MYVVGGRMWSGWEGGSELGGQGVLRFPLNQALSASMFCPCIQLDKRKKKKKGVMTKSQFCTSTNRELKLNQELVVQIPGQTNPRVSITLSRVTRTTCVSCLAMRVTHSLLTYLPALSISLAESQHGVLYRQGSIMRQVRI